MSNLIKINSQNIQIKEFKNQRVLTFKDIDTAHERPEGTAKRNFNENKKHFILGTDYFVRNSYEAKAEFDIIAPNGLTIITEFGYLMLVKSFTDDLAWKVQRELVNNYFKVKEQEQITSLEDKQKLTEARIRNAKAREASILLKIANSMDVSKEYKQVLFSHATVIIAGKPLLPLPEVEQTTLSAEEVGKELGVTANKVGRIAKANNLKTEQYGKWFHDKSRYSNKEVPSFRYYRNVIPVIKTLLNQKQVD